MCLTPLFLKEHGVKVPCGKCPECRARRASAWSFRLREEDKISHSSSFITLTYDTRTVPITKNGYMSLSKRDVQLFFKRLRKAHKAEAQKSIKYYAAAEYGGKTKRPHYHIILFNADISLVQEAWNKGSVHYGDVTGASVGYSLKYITKPGKIPQHRNDDRQPEFALMSKSSVPTTLHLKCSDGTKQTSKTECIVISRTEKKSVCLGITKIKSIQRKNALG